MTLSLATINVNGLRDKKKRDLVFNWLVAKKIDVICLQETHSTKDDLIRWQNEWKTVGVAIAFLIVVRVTQGVWEFYWAKNLKKV
jgi:exonuclease III